MKSVNIEGIFLLLLILPVVYYNLPDGDLSYSLWHIGNAATLWLFSILIRLLLPQAKERWYSYAVILSTFTMINLLDELFGHPEKHEPSEYIMGTGVIVYEIIQYFRRKKLNSNV